MKAHFILDVRRSKLHLSGKEPAIACAFDHPPSGRVGAAGEGFCVNGLIRNPPRRKELDWFMNQLDWSMKIGLVYESAPSPATRASRLTLPEGG